MEFEYVTTSSHQLAPDASLENYERRKGVVVLALLQKRLGSLAGKRILEIGPSTGMLMRMLQDAGAEVHAIDIDSPWSSEYRFDAEKRTLINLETEPLPSRMKDSFDLVIAQEVIEHIKRPYDFLQQLRLALRSGGVVFLTTPNLVGVTAWLKGEKWCGLSTPTHYILYSPRSLSFLLYNAGFRPLSVFANLIPISTASGNPVFQWINKLLAPLKFGGGLMGFYALDSDLPK